MLLTDGAGFAFGNALASTMPLCSKLTPESFSKLRPLHLNAHLAPVAGNGFGGVNGYDVPLMAGAYPLTPLSARPGHDGSPVGATCASKVAPHKLDSQRRASDPWLATTRRRSALLPDETALVGSVAYETRHWHAQTVSGDRVIEPRPAYRRIASLLWAPHPRLEVLPASTHGRARDSTSENDHRSTISAGDATDGWEQADAASEHPGRTGSPVRALPSTPQPPGRFPDEERQSAPGSIRRRASYLLDGLSAMLLPKLVPGIHIGPDVRIADDDERTLVDEYEARL